MLMKDSWPGWMKATILFWNMPPSKNVTIYKGNQGPSENTVRYLSGNQANMRPAMTSADNILLFNLGNNAYEKPATALNILRETILGRELFDQALQNYSEKWAFKHPKPADFFRCMEDASGTDLDWFWKGWFYGTEAVDISLDTMVYYKMDPNTELSDQTNPFENPIQFVISKTSEAYYWEIKNRLDDSIL